MRHQFPRKHWRRTYATDIECNRTLVVLFNRLFPRCPAGAPPPSPTPHSWELPSAPARQRRQLARRAGAGANGPRPGQRRDRKIKRPFLPPAGARARSRPARPTLPAWCRPCPGGPEAPHASIWHALHGPGRTGLGKGACAHHWLYPEEHRDVLYKTQQGRGAKAD